MQHIFQHSPIFKHSPINLNDWIEKNKQTLLPPINNRQFWKEDWQNLMVMMVGGPNYRPDYHDDPVFGFPVTSHQISVIGSTEATHFW